MLMIEVDVLLALSRLFHSAPDYMQLPKRFKIYKTGLTPLAYDSITHSIIKGKHYHVIKNEVAILPRSQSAILHKNTSFFLPILVYISLFGYKYM